MSIRITSGAQKGRRLRAPRSAGLRPTSERVRGAIFSILGQEAVEGARVLDLYAGTGALGIEALSRGADWADFVEADARRCIQIRDNLRELGLAQRGHVYQSRVEKAITILTSPYDLVFIDPPYDLDPWDWLMNALSERGLVKANGLVVAEHSPRTSLASRYGRLVLETGRRYGDTSVSIYKVGNDNG